MHQGEGNRDELVIRGVDSSANFFVNGFRDDVQIFRDLYNTQSIEVLKGPSALTFGRGSGGGLRQPHAQGSRLAHGPRGDAADRLLLATGASASMPARAINENFAARLNAFYEKSDTFRDFGNLERYGFNPTVTLKPNDTTKFKLSYEYLSRRTHRRSRQSLAGLERGGAVIDPLQSGRAVRAERRPVGILRQPDPERRARRRANRRWR